MLQEDKSKEYVGKITKELKEFTDVAVVGLSGGVDSLCIAVLCKLALGDENVFVVHMPHNRVDTENPLKFNGNSFRIAKKLGVKELIADVGDISYLMNTEIESAFLDIKLSPVNSGNVRSRARMCILYGVSHHLGDVTKKRVRVIGTGNLSEDFIGYDTKGGDALADIFPIGELYKSEVYQLAEHFVSLGLIEEDMIDRHPSAGLWDGQSDEAELGFTYNDMQPAIELLLTLTNINVDLWLEHRPDEKIFHEDFGVDKKMVEFVWNRHKANKHKHEAPPVIKVKS